MREKDVFSDAFLTQPSLVTRLAESIREATREFRENPRQYFIAAIKGEGIGGHLRIDRLRCGLALALAIYMIVLGMSILVSAIHRPPSDSGFRDLPITILINPGPAPERTPPGDSDQDAGGGGGGGGGELRAASLGQPAPFDLSEPVIAPTTRPTIEPPALPFPETLLGVPQPAVAAPTGLPTGTPGPPSDGPGANGGIGTGDNGGVGPGRGSGYGPGENGGRGGGTYGASRARPGADASAFSSRPIALNHPRPNYTEEARKQRVQGVVKASVLVGADGAVKSVRIVSGLPDGLEEEAIRAAYEMRFRPAVSNGRPIACWVTLEIEFNLR